MRKRCRACEAASRAARCWPAVGVGPIPVWTGLRAGSEQATQVAEGRRKKKSGTAVARTAAAKPDAKPANAPQKPKPGKAGNRECFGRGLQPDALDQAPQRQQLHTGFRRDEAVAAPASGDKNGAAKPKSRCEA